MDDNVDASACLIDAVTERLKVVMAGKSSESVSELLASAKALCGHGGWSDYVTITLGKSMRWAQIQMRKSAQPKSAQPKSASDKSAISKNANYENRSDQLCGGVIILNAVARLDGITKLELCRQLETGGFYQAEAQEDTQAHTILHELVRRYYANGGDSNDLLEELLEAAPDDEKHRFRYKLLCDGLRRGLMSASEFARLVEIEAGRR